MLDDPLSVTVDSGISNELAKPTHRQKADLIRQKLVAVNDQQNADVPRVCIDMGMSNLMSEKEIGSLVSQVRQVYGANRKAEKPLQVWLTNLDKEGNMYHACVKKNDGFQNYLMNMTEKHYYEIFPKPDVIYLTPDAPQKLTTVEANKVYVIGGLVDEQVIKHCTYEAASANGIQTASLPILSCMRHAAKGTYSKVLTVNQVFDILLTFYNTNSWEDALIAGVPRRKGFIPR